jgi:hypothetical protein
MAKILNTRTYAFPFRNQIGLNLSLEIEDSSLLNNNLHVIVCFDKSGSMGEYGGKPINEAREATKTLLRECEKLGAEMSILPFNGEVTFMDFSGSREQKERLIDTIIPDGGTSFANAVYALCQLLQSTKKELHIIFMTDGLDSDSSAKFIDQQLNSFKELITKQMLSCRIHCLGFGVGHDAVFLNKLTQHGTSLGTFQYVKDAGEIQKAMESITGLLSNNLMSTILEINGVKHQLILNENIIDEKKSLYRGTLFTNTTCEKLTLLINQNKKETQIELINYV